MLDRAEKNPAKKILVGLMLLGILFGALWWAKGSGWQYPCPFRQITGLCCPGCGMTGAFSHLLSGEWSLAFRQNILAIPVFLGFCGMGVTALYDWIFQKDTLLRGARWMKSRRVLLFCSAAWLAVWSVGYQTGNAFLFPS